MHFCWNSLALRAYILSSYTFKRYVYISACICSHIFVNIHCCSVAQLCPTLCDPMDCSMPGFPIPHHLPEFAQVCVHCIDDAIQPSHPLTPSSALNLSQHQGLFQSVACWNQKTIASWQLSDDKPRRCIEKQRHYSADRGPYSQGYGLPSGHVQLLRAGL